MVITLREPRGNEGDGNNTQSFQDDASLLALNLIAIIMLVLYLDASQPDNRNKNFPGEKTLIKIILMTMVRFRHNIQREGFAERAFIQIEYSASCSWSVLDLDKEQSQSFRYRFNYHAHKGGNHEPKYAN